MLAGRLLVPLALLALAACRSSVPRERAPEPILGRPLVLHGHAVPWEDVRLAVCEGHAGVAAIERARERIAGDAKDAVVQYHPAPGVLRRVNGTDITVREIWSEILPVLTEMDVREAKQWLANTILLRAELERGGAWLTDDEAEAVYRAHSDPYKDSIFSQERLALVIKRFPSVERYEEYHRIHESFARMKAAEMTEEALAAQAEFRTNKMAGQVTVDVDVLLCSAFDLESGRWKEDGWTTAERRMKDVLQLLVEEQEPWEELLERYSDFPAEVRAGLSMEEYPAPDRGRFRQIQRNPLLAQLGESEYGLFLNGGDSITDWVFFEQEVNTLGQPMRGPYGWYLPRLIRRTKPLPVASVRKELLKDLVKEDYLLWHLNALARELVRKAAAEV